MVDQPEEISIGGPVTREGDDLVLLIPLEAGGSPLAANARGIGEIRGEYLRVVIPPWLAEQLTIGEGSNVIVDNLEGKLNITRDD